MSVSYSAVGHGNRDSSDDDAEVDGLLNGRAPSSVRIESYIPPRKRTILFDTA